MDSSPRLKRKRPHPLVLNGSAYTFEDKSNDFLCPICFEIIEEAQVTKCGHTFCHKCISTSLQMSSRCPKCNFIVEEVFPNFLLNELIAKHHKTSIERKIGNDHNNLTTIKEIQLMILQKSDKLNLSDINNLLDLLSQKKKQVEETAIVIQNQLLNEFLSQVRAHKQEQLQHLTKELHLIDEDHKRVQELLKNESEAIGKRINDNGPSNSVDSSSVMDNGPLSASEPSSSGCNLVGDGENFNDSKLGSSEADFISYSQSLKNRRKKMQIHFEDLEQNYFNNRAKNVLLSSCGDPDTCGDGLREFTETLNKFTLYSSLRPLATLLYTTDPFNVSSIVSSIEFDKDNEFFAIAGVTKKIKLFEYSTVVKDSLDIHYPMTEMECNSKISCVSWSSYFKSMMASSDYEGSVTIWDAFTSTRLRVFQEHEKRCWSVDFNKVDTKLVSSGSDDAKVKLWAIDCEHSITTLEAKANVCCVKFNPTNRYHVAFGSADHCVHYYDLRNYKQPLMVFKGHKKAVSYVKFLNSTEIVSASTDSQLKLWNTNKAACQRSFKGHSNEKNFVGLATDGDYIACGSENNSIYVYYKGVSRQTLSFWFDSNKEKEKREDETSDFTSAVCWRMGTNVLVAANSQGVIKVLELI